MGDAGRLQRVALVLAVVALSLAVVGLSLWVFDLLAATGASADDLTPVVLQDSTGSASSDSTDGAGSAPPSVTAGALTAADGSGEEANEPSDPVGEADQSVGTAGGESGGAALAGVSGDDTARSGSHSEELERLTVAPPTQSREYPENHGDESEDHSEHSPPATERTYGTGQGATGSEAPGAGAAGQGSSGEGSSESHPAEGASDDRGSVEGGSVGTPDGSGLGYQDAESVSGESDAPEAAQPSREQQLEQDGASKQDEG